MNMDVERVTASIYEPAKWTRDSNKVARRVKRWRQKAWYDARAESFALSKARYDNSDDQWEVCSCVSRIISTSLISILVY